MTWELEGSRELLARLKGVTHSKERRFALTGAAAIIRKEARRLAPRKTGKLEKAIKTHRKTNTVWVGVAPTSNAWLRGFMIEKVYGGTATNPRRAWPTKTKASATMPFLSTAVHNKGAESLEEMKRRLLVNLK